MTVGLDGVMEILSFASCIDETPNLCSLDGVLELSLAIIFFKAKVGQLLKLTLFGVEV